MTIKEMERFMVLLEKLREDWKKTNSVLPKRSYDAIRTLNIDVRSLIGHKEHISRARVRIAEKHSAGRGPSPAVTP